MKLTAISFALLLVLGFVLFSGSVQLGAAEPSSSGPPQLSGSVGGAPHLILNVAATDSAMVAYVQSDAILNDLRPGDTIDLLHDPQLALTPAGIAQINSEAAEFVALAPKGVAVTAHSGYIPILQALGKGVASPVSGLVGTLEPDGITPGENYSFASALSYFEQLNTVAHANGLTSVAYPTGSFLPEGPEAKYGWNYGEIAATTDFEWIETQRFAMEAINDSAVWSKVLATLVSQFTGAGQPLSKLAIQVTLGNDGHGSGTDPQVAIKAIQMALAVGITNIDLWIFQGYDSELGATLAGLSRPAAPPSVTFTEVGLPSGAGWSVTLNGTVHSSESSAISFSEPNGTYGFSVLSPTVAENGTRYLASPSTGSVDVSGANVAVSIAYEPQYYLETVAFPTDGGTVSPGNGWCAAGQTVSLLATPASGGSFSNWSGQGAGSYDGPSNPVTLSVLGPINETAEFAPSSGNLLPVSFIETGLPTGTPWNVSLNGQKEASTSATVVFQVVGGSYDYAVGTPDPGANSGTQYEAALSAGTVVVGNSSVAVEVPYSAEYNLAVSVSPVGSGGVTPSGGWFAANSEVTLSAVPATGYNFAVWAGTGAGSYTGPDPSPQLTVESPVTEEAEFVQPHVTSALSFVVTGLPPGTNWNTEVGGFNWTTNQSTITIPTPEGFVDFAVESPIPVAPGVEYVALPSSGTVNLTGGPVGVTVSYVPEAFLAFTSTGLGAVTMTPEADGWYPFGSTVKFTAAALPGSVFAGWNGIGNGSYTGSENPVGIVVAGPFAEVAHFVSAFAPPPMGGNSMGGAGSWSAALGPAVMVAVVAGVVIGMNVAVRTTQRFQRRREKR